MAPTIRTRIWISYLVIIVVLLFSMVCGMAVTLRNSPLLYRTVLLRIKVAEAVLVQKLVDRMDIQDAELLAALQDDAANRQLRIQLLGEDGLIVFDSEPNAAVLDPIPLEKTDHTDSSLALPTVRDLKGNTWFYSIRMLDSGNQLIVAARKTAVPLRILFRDELFGPILISAGIALFAALLLGIGLSRWIIRPIDKMIRASQEMAEGMNAAMPSEGPGELQKLANALNSMNEQVNASNQSQKDFLANITHELKTPLTSIQGFAQSIMDGTAKDEKDVRKAANVIFDEAARMNRLVLDLLTLSRLEAGLTDLKKEPVDLDILLHNIVEKFQGQAVLAKIELLYETTDIPRVMGDGDRLAQVFGNVIDNSLKYTRAGGKVQVNAQGTLQGVEIRIKDTGIGIAVENQEKIFNRFFQEDRSRRGGGVRGVGLGLSIVKQIVKAHAGTIRVESEPGKGSTFVIFLPFSTPTDSTMVPGKVGR